MIKNMLVMHKSSGKIKYYIVSLSLLGLLASCDTDFGLDGSKDEPADSNMVAEPDVIEVDIDSEIQADTLIEETRTQERSNQEIRSEKMWRVVIASSPNEAKIQKLATSLGTSGFEILFVPELNTYRLAYKSHPSLPLAQNTLEQIRGQFPDAWIIYF